jgi:hypothetical protein
MSRRRSTWVRAIGEDTALAEIAGLMEAAGQSRSRYVRIADRASRLYAPAVHSLAALTFAGWMLAGAGFYHALVIAIAVLIITCPCALLAVPVAQVVAAGALMKRGILDQGRLGAGTAGRSGPRADRQDRYADPRTPGARPGALDARWAGRKRALPSRLPATAAIRLAGAGPGARRARGAGRAARRGGGSRRAGHERDMERDASLARASGQFDRRHGRRAGHWQRSGAADRFSDALRPDCAAALAALGEAGHRMLDPVGRYDRGRVPWRGPPD